jgi:hypothetical protein
MKNVTVTLPEELATRARVAAARENKSLSRYIADLLAEKCDGSVPANDRDAAIKALEDFLSGPGFPDISKNWKGRDELYAERDQKLLRRHDDPGVRKGPQKSRQTTDRLGFAEDDRQGRYVGPQRSKRK